MMNGDSDAEVLLISADLFLGSRIRGAVTAKGASLSVVDGSATAVERLGQSSFSLVLIDLETPGLNPAEIVQAAKATEATPTVAYAPHVKEQLLTTAKKAGCTEVLSRGKFDATLSEILGRHLASEA